LCTKGIPESCSPEGLQFGSDREIVTVSQEAASASPVAEMRGVCASPASKDIERIQLTVIGDREGGVDAEIS